jgi:radical SAM superfamily enzyme YgiQ (UPF0313 family)
MIFFKQYANGMTPRRNIHHDCFAEDEIGSIRKAGKAKVEIALIYPNRYHVGMSNLGFQTVYALLNDVDDVRCERAFLPESIGDAKADVKTIESGRRISVFDILAFSVSFENDFPNLLSILDMGGLPLQSAKRSFPHPLVIAGGVACFLNPEPIASFIDCIFIGEAEEILPSFLECVLTSDPVSEPERESLLQTIAQKVSGVYVPRFYSASYHSDGTIREFKATSDVPNRIFRIFSKDLSLHETHSRILTPKTAFGNTFLIEIGRGCTHGCRFCAAGYAYRPPRFRPESDLEKSIEKKDSRINKIGIVGASISDYPGIDSLCSFILSKDLRAGFSSLRADVLTPSLLEALGRNKTQTATLAPDAGSERMRTVINKGMAESDILNTVACLIETGILNLKLYFMVGLPTETMEDVEAVVSLCKRIKHQALKSGRNKGRMGSITVSLNSFVPKPFTPFQWAAMDTEILLKAKIKKIKESLKRIPNIRIHADIPRWAFIQGIFSLGDRRVGEVLMAGFKNQGNWAKTLKESVINPSFYVHRVKSFEEVLPWDFIEHGLKKSFLFSEYQRALSGIPTPPCPVKSCHMCGVC